MSTMCSEDGSPLPLAGNVYRPAQPQGIPPVPYLYHGFLLLVIRGQWVVGLVRGAG